MRFVSIDETVIATACRPPLDGAPTLVFANSLGTDYRIWQYVVDHLPMGLGVLLYDKRGHGLSELGPDASVLQRHVDDLQGIIAEAGIGRHVVCGLSVGGVIAQAYAHTRPEGLAGLVLSNTAPRVGPAQIWDTRIAAVREGGLASIADGVMERWFSPAFRTTQTATLAGMRTMLSRQEAAGYIAICEMLRAADLTAGAGTIAVPTLCIAGTADQSTPPDLVEAMAGQIPGAAFALIEGVGHIPCVEAPQVYAERLLSFLEQSQIFRG